MFQKCIVTVTALTLVILGVGYMTAQPKATKAPNREADKNRGRNQAVGGKLAELEPRRRWRERADPKRIEEVDDRSKHETLDAGPSAPHDRGSPKHDRKDERREDDRDHQRVQHG